MATRQGSRNEVWKYFDNIVEEGTAVCKTCQQRLRNNRSFNLRQHLKKVHNIEIEGQDASTNSLYSPQPYDEEQITAVLKAAKRKMQEDRLQQHDTKRSKKRIYIEMERRTIVQAIMGLMVEDGVGPHLFDSKNLLSLIKPICDAISYQDGKEFKINAVMAERSLNMVANNIRNDFSNELYWRLLSLKVDTDLNASSKTYCVSAQFVNEGQTESRALGVIQLHKEEHQFTEQHLKNILQRFKIDCGQILAVCWDNTKAKFTKQVKNCEYLKEIENYDEYPDIYLGDVKVERYIGAIAQLCLLDIFKNTKIFQPFMECRNLAKYLNDESNGFFQIFETNQLRIPQIDSPWKWGSTYNMINDLYLARSVVQNFKYEQSDTPEDQFTLNDQLWLFVEAVVKSLSFMQKSILRYYGEEQHFGDFYAQWLKCKLLTEKLVTDNQNHFIALISSELLKGIEKRSKQLLGVHRFEACLYLDPRFQHTLNLQQKTNALEFLKKLWSKAKIYNADVIKSSGKAESPIQLQFDDDEDAFLNEFLSQDVLVKDITTSDVHARIERLKLPFQMVDTNILFFWRELKFSEPEMHALSSICFAMPATQKYSKVRYSHVLATYNSLKLSKFSKDNLLFVQLNPHLLDDAMDQVDIFKDDVLSTPDMAQPSLDADSLHSDKDLSTRNDSTMPTSASPPYVLNAASTEKELLKSDIPIILANNENITNNAPTTVAPTIPVTTGGTALLPPNITIKRIKNF